MQALNGEIFDRLINHSVELELLVTSQLCNEFQAFRLIVSNGRTVPSLSPAQMALVKKRS